LHYSTAAPPAILSSISAHEADATVDLLGQIELPQGHEPRNAKSFEGIYESADQGLKHMDYDGGDRVSSASID
jgi:hypothetical protein